MRLIATAVAHLALIAIALFGMVAMHGRARADDQPKLTILDCQTVLAGLSGLDGRQEVAGGAAITVPYKFGSATLRLAIQQNIAALTAVQQAFTKSQQGLFREIAGDATTELKPNTPEFARYQRLVLEAQQGPCDVKLTRIKAADLKLDINEIPGSVLGALDKILDR